MNKRVCDYEYLINTPLCVVEETLISPVITTLKWNDGKEYIIAMYKIIGEN